MHQALYRKYRPRTFDDVAGQEHITDVLRYEVTEGRCSHAYLFCGSRGTGKTTCAKILAKAINCENPVNGSPCLKCASCRDIDSGSATDVIEMDAASNNGVDSIRAICDEAMYTPAMLKKKVYIIDEVHMLSQGAFNALLKTIEEPPEHIVFILATTELHKIPATIVSRCQRFDFRRIEMRTIAKRLEYIAGCENIALDSEAALLLARQAQGGMRDAIGLMELCSAGGAAVSAEKVKEVLGLSGYDTAAQTMDAVSARDVAGLFRIVSEVVSGSKDISVFWQELISFTRDMLVSKYADNSAAYLDITDQESKVLNDTAAKFGLASLIYICKILDDGASRMLRSPQTRRSIAELSLLKMCRPELDSSAEALSARIAKLEDAVALGLPIQTSPKPQEDKTETDNKSAAPASEKTPQKVETAEESAAQGSADRSAVSNSFERVRDISEAVGRLDGGNRGLASFLMGAEAYVSADGKHLRLCVDGFAETMFKADGAREAISNAFALAKITDGRASVEVVKKGAHKASESLADELGKML